METIVRPLELFLERTEEIEPQIAYTNQSLEHTVKENKHDFIIERRGNLTYLHGDTTDPVFQDIIANMNEVIKDVSEIRIVFRDQEVNTDATDE